jgi:glycosyltransferase A (GT-A) superfamily protein (DUF2064 family)
MEKQDHHDPRFADMLRRAAQDTHQQEKRLATIFGKKEIPQVNEDTLAMCSPMWRGVPLCFGHVRRGATRITFPARFGSTR